MKSECTTLRHLLFAIITADNNEIIVDHHTLNLKIFCDLYTEGPRTSFYILDTLGAWSNRINFKLRSTRHLSASQPCSACTTVPTWGGEQGDIY
jgi:hypothetical protein